MIVISTDTVVVCIGEPSAIVSVTDICGDSIFLRVRLKLKTMFIQWRRTRSVSPLKSELCFSESPCQSCHILIFHQIRYFIKFTSRTIYPFTAQ